MALKSHNPVLRESIFTNADYQTSVVGAYDSVPQVGRMTIEGTIHRAFFLLCLVVASASITWGMALTNPKSVMSLMMLGLIGGLIAAIVTTVKPNWSPISGSIYAIFEGLAIGGISAIYNIRMPGIVLLAVGLTIGVLFALLAAYRSGLVQVTQKFRAGMLAAMGGVLLVSFGAIILSLFGVNVSMVFGNGPLALGFSLVVTVVAALNLVLDFDFIEKGSQMGLPKYFEWYAAFGLLVTLIWLYLELLRLLAILNRRN